MVRGGVAPGFHQLQFPPAARAVGWLWFEVWFQGLHKVLCAMVRGGPRGGPEVLQGSTKGIQKCSARFRGFAYLCGGGTEKPSEQQKLAVLMGGTLSKTEINGFQHTFIVLSPAHLLGQRGPKCCKLALWQIRSRCCGTHGAAE